MKAAEYRVTWRDRLAYRLSMTVMLIATPQYRGFIKAGFIIGMRRLDEEVSRQEKASQKLGRK